MIEQIEVAKNCGAAYIDNLLQEMLLGGAMVYPPVATGAAAATTAATATTTSGNSPTSPGSVSSPEDANIIEQYNVPLPPL